MDGAAWGVVSSESRATVPSEQEMERIRPYLGDQGEEMERARLYVRRMALANTGEDRGYTRIPVNILTRLAETLPGKSVLLSHDDDRLPVGLWYHAEVRSARSGEYGTHTLEARFYMTRDEHLRPYQSLIDAGVLRYGSIAFVKDVLLCDVCGMKMGWYGEDVCPHYPGQTLPEGRRVTYEYAGDVAKYESYEGSLVSLGRQRLAQIIYNDAGGGGMSEAELRALVGQMEERLAAKQIETDAKLDGLLEQVARLSVVEPADPNSVEAEGVAQSGVLWEDALTEVARLEALVGREDAVRARLMTPSELVAHKQKLQEEVAQRFPVGVRSESAAAAALIDEGRRTMPVRRRHQWF